MNAFGKFCGIFGFAVLVYLIGDLLRRYCNHLGDRNQFNVLGWLASRLSFFLFFCVLPVTGIFYFLQNQDAKRASTYALDDYKKEQLPIQQQLAFAEGFREGFAYCAEYCCIEGTDKKPEYTRYVAEHCEKRMKRAYPTEDDRREFRYQEDLGYYDD